MTENINRQIQGLGSNVGYTVTFCMVLYKQQTVTNAVGFQMT